MQDFLFMRLHQNIHTWEFIMIQLISLTAISILLNRKKKKSKIILIQMTSVSKITCILPICTMFSFWDLVTVCYCWQWIQIYKINMHAYFHHHLLLSIQWDKDILLFNEKARSPRGPVVLPGSRNLKNVCLKLGNKWGH